MSPSHRTPYLTARHRRRPPLQSYQEFEKWVQEKSAKYTDKTEGMAEMM